uniref:Uncharacterized protein n=1 Tax=Aplanochytrium stocchinoi TaxID=215587 RepID=A0A7S3V2V9_9STRA
MAVKRKYSKPQSLWNVINLRWKLMIQSSPFRFCHIYYNEDNVTLEFCPTCYKIGTRQDTRSPTALLTNFVLEHEAFYAKAESGTETFVCYRLPCSNEESSCTYSDDNGINDAGGNYSEKPKDVSSKVSAAGSNAPEENKTDIESIPSRTKSVSSFDSALASNSDHDQQELQLNASSSAKPNTTQAKAPDSANISPMI